MHTGQHTPSLLTSTPDKASRKLSRATLRRSLALVIAAVAAQTGLAQTVVEWVGSRNTAWSNPNNWSGTVPSATDTASFLRRTNKDPSLTADTAIGSLVFSGTADAEALTGAGYNLTINSVNGIGIDLQFTRTVTFAPNVTLGASQTWQATNAGGGAITLNGSLNLNGFNLTMNPLNSGNSVTVNGAISGTGALVKDGAGSATLGGATANTYTGTTTVNAGTLILAKATNVNAVTGNLIIGNGAGSATVQLNADHQIADNAAVILASGGTPTFSINVRDETVGSISSSNTAAVISLGAGNLTTGADNTSTTFAGTITGGGGDLIKVGTGTFTLSSNTSTYTSSTIINGGVLSIGSLANASTASALGSATSVNSNLIMDGGTLRYTGGQTSTNRLFSIGTGGATIESAGTGMMSFTNTGQLGYNSQSGARTLTLTGAGDGLIASTLADSGGATSVVKSGAGTWTLSGNNSYSGTTRIQQGALVAASSNAFGSSNIIVESGGSFGLSGGTTMTTAGALTLSGSGTGSAAAFQSLAGAGQTSTYRGNIALAADATIGASGGLFVIGDGNAFTDTINLANNTLTIDTPTGPTVTPIYGPVTSYALDPSNVVMYSNISGTGGLVKTGSGTLTLMPVVGGSSFTGDTVITGGKVIVDSSENVPAINSHELFVGNASYLGEADSVILQIGQLGSGPGANNMIGTWSSTTNASGSNLTLYADAMLHMNNGSNGFVHITMRGGHVNGGNSTYRPLLTVSGSLTTESSGRTALIDNGNLAMSAPSNFTYSVASGTTSSGVDLQIDSVVQNGVGYTGGSAGTNMVKAGSGKMVLTGANTYSGVTDVTAGILNIQNNSALGQYGSTLGDTQDGTVVRSNAQLQVQGDITVGSETLTLNGSGISGDGALRSVAGSNTYRGFVRLDGDARINADAGSTLNIAHPTSVNSTILNGTSAGKNLTVGGGGDTNINGGIGAQVGGIAKDGAGTLTLAGSNAYTGATNVTSGTVKVTNSSGLSGSGVTVANGATLAFARDGNNNDISTLGVNASIAGSGVNGEGAIRNLSGNNAHAGTISFASNSLITADAGTSLTFSGGSNSSGGPGATLQIGTSGHNGNIHFSGTVNNGSSVSTAAGLRKEGSGTLTFSSDGNNVVGAVSLNAGGLTVGNGANTTVQTQNFDAAAGTSMLIAGGGKLDITGNATLRGTIDSNSHGTIVVNGNHNLSFLHSIDAPDLKLVFNGGGTQGGPLYVYLGGYNINVGTIEITGDTILDFGGSANTVLSSAALKISNPNATIQVVNWVSVANQASMSTIWYATSTINNNPLGSTNQVGGSPLSQITFSPPNGSPYNVPTTWVADTSSGWFGHEIRPTPEPGTYGAILMSGCLGFLAWRRFQRRRASA